MTTPAPCKPHYATREYAISVRFSAPDGGFVATVAEFPSLSAIQPTPGAAADSIYAVVDDVLHEMAELGETIPIPLQLRGEINAKNRRRGVRR